MQATASCAIHIDTPSSEN
jgi:hypothetical protein